MGTAAGAPRLYTINDLASAANVHRCTVYEWLRDGKIRITHRLGPKSPRFSSDEVHRFLRTREA